MKELIQKSKNYLRFKNSTTLLKFRGFTNCLNRYSYVLLPRNQRNTQEPKEKAQSCRFCNKPKTKENLSHLLWECPTYTEPREKWKMKMGKILKKGEYQKIIQGWNTNGILNLITKQEIFELLKNFFKSSLRLRKLMEPQQNEENSSSNK